LGAWDVGSAGAQVAAHDLSTEKECDSLQMLDVPSLDEHDVALLERPGEPLRDLFGSVMSVFDGGRSPDAACAGAHAPEAGRPSREDDAGSDPSGLLAEPRVVRPLRARRLGDVA